MFVPGDFKVPAHLSNEKFHFEVLEPSLSDLDYEAVMSSKERLRQVFAKNDEWPEEDMSYEFNKNDLIIATKFGHAYKKKHKNDSYDLKSVKLQLENSLRALKRDYIDIYYFHAGNNEQFFNDDLWEFLNREVKKGKIRYLGLSLKHDLVLKKNYKQIKNLKKSLEKIISDKVFI